MQNNWLFCDLLEIQVDRFEWKKGGFDFYEYLETKKLMIFFQYFHIVLFDSVGVFFVVAITIS